MYDNKNSIQASTKKIKNPMEKWAKQINVKFEIVEILIYTNIKLISLVTLKIQNQKPRGIPFQLIGFTPKQK